MKKKSSRRGSGEKSRPEKAAQEETAAGSGSSSEAEHTSGDAGKSAGKKSLPAFGFAADLLKKTSGPAASPSADEKPSSPEAEVAPVSSISEPVLGTDTSFSTGLSSASDVDSQAPTRVFDFADRLDDGGRRGEEQAVPVKIGTFVAFDLAGETYAMPVEPVRQVVRVSNITRVPHAPRPIRGVTNLRGRVIPVIDLRLRIGLAETDIGRSSRVVSVSSRGRLIGLLVDAVHQVVHLDLFKVQPPPDDVMTMQSDYIEGVYGEGDDLILLLDIDKALIIREAGAA